MNSTERRALVDLTQRSTGFVHLFLNTHLDESQFNEFLKALVSDLRKMSETVHQCNINGGRGFHVVLPIDNEERTQRRIDSVLGIAREFEQETVLIARREKQDGPLQARIQFLDEVGASVEIGRLAFVSAASAANQFADAYTTFGSEPAFALVAVTDDTKAAAVIAA